MSRRPFPGRRVAFTMLVACVTASMVGVVPGATALASPATGGSGATGTRVVVDDDGAQCPQADVTSIQAGVDRAGRGGSVMVCPGRYAERVLVPTSVTIQGAPQAVADLGCPDPNASAVEDLDPSRFAILQPPPQGEATLLRLSADGIRVTGLVVQGFVDTTVEEPVPGTLYYDAAIAAGDEWSGIRLDRNLVQGNTFGVELGAANSRVDDNCFRGNDWDLANQRYDLRQARVDHNTTVGTGVIAWELGASHAPSHGVRFDHNVSSGAGYATYYITESSDVEVSHNVSSGAEYAVYIAESSDVTVSHNELQVNTYGVFVAPRSAGVRVADNVITSAGDSSGVNGVVVPSPGEEQPTTGLVVTRNTVSGMHSTSIPGRAILLAPNSQPAGAVVSDNLVTDSYEGIAVGTGNRRVRVQGNTALRNAFNGIRLSAGATQNVLIGNTALDNANDVRDMELAISGPTATSNQWVRTTCVTDIPTGAICVSR